MPGWAPWALQQHPPTAATAAAKSLQSCPTLCNPINGSPPGPTVPGILQARTLEWVAISFSNAWKWKVKVKSPSRVQLLVTPWTAAYQAPPSMGFSRQKYWSGFPLPSPNIPLVICFTHGNVYVSRILSKIIPCSPCVHKSVLYVWVSIPAMQTGSFFSFNFMFLREVEMYLQILIRQILFFTVVL